MELNQLTPDEQVALVALLELIVESNARVSEEEADRLGTVIDAIGEDAYRRAAEEVDRRFADEDAVRAFVPEITRQDARDLIYGTLFEAAITDTVDSHESELLDWLAGVWHIDTQLDEP